MGAWGYGVYENDGALDLKLEFDKCIENGIGVEETSDEILQNSYYGTDNSALLALADLQLKHMGKIKDNFRDKVMMALNEELTNIGYWREPEQRRKALLDFKEKITSV